MIRSEELVDELVATLHFHNYLKMESANIFGGGPMTVAANDHKKDNIQDYIDDLYIDFFFRTESFKPILIPNSWKIQKFTDKGKKYVEGGLQLNLSNPFDRYTFLDCISRALSGNDGYLLKMFPGNAFLRDIMVITKKYGPIWYSISLVFGHPNGDEFEQYLNFLYGYKHSKYKPLIRALDILKYSEFFQTVIDKYSYKGLTNIGLYKIEKRQQDYRKIKDLNVFGDYTIEEVLMFYCLLVDKFKLGEDNFLSFIGLFANNDGKTNRVLSEFRKFEIENTNSECLKPFIRERDLFLRFTSATKSKAVKFEHILDGVVEIQFFGDPPLHSICENNTLPLPYLYNELY